MKRKRALITGASRGIGRAAAAAFAKEGYDLILNCIHSADALRELAGQLEKEHHIRVCCCIGDVGDDAFVCRMFEEAWEFCGGLDVLVNNAGISYMGLLGDMPYEEWERIMRTNVTSVYACCKHAIPFMLSQKAGKIINVSSVWGIYGASCEAAYSASKGAVNALTKALAKELAPSGIQVNAVACGVIDTDMNAGLCGGERGQLMEEIPAGRFATPQEAADLIFRLAHAPDYLTGQVIAFDGGWW